MDFYRCILLGAAFVGGSVFAAEPNQNPFAPAGAPPPVAQAEPNSLELRGIVSGTNGQTVFGVFDPVRRQSSWLRLDETGHDFVVRAHDEARRTVRVDYNGRTIELQLKEAKIETAAQPMPMPMPAPQMQAPRPGGVPPAMPQPQPQVAATPNAAEEAKRLEGVAQEVRRRRMMRAQAGQQGQPPPPPQPAQGNQPR